MAVKPVVIALSRSGEPVAHRVAAHLDALVHGREGRVDRICLPLACLLWGFVPLVF